MAKKDLRKTLDGIEKSGDVTARMEEKIRRLTELVQRQKKIISDQTGLLDTQKSKLSEIDDVPDDIIELKRIIGQQRAQIREKDLALDHAKGSMVQAQQELELYLKRKNPQQIKLEGALETIGTLKAELAQKNTELNVKNETLQTLANRVKEAKSQADAIKQQMENIKGEVSKKEFDELKIKSSEERQNLKQKISKLETQLVEEKIKVVEDLKIKYSEERQNLKQKMKKMESQLLDQKLEFQEKTAEAKEIVGKFDDMKNKLNELSDKNIDFKEKIKSQEVGMVDLKKFKEENYSKIFIFDKLKPLLEEDPIFRAFFIIQDVGSISLDDLRASVGAPMVIVKKEVARLEKIGVIEMGADGKIKAKKIE